MYPSFVPLARVRAGVEKGLLIVDRGEMRLARIAAVSTLYKRSKTFSGDEAMDDVTELAVLFGVKV